MKTLLIIFLAIILCFSHPEQSSDCSYESMIELREACGDHFELFVHGFPEGVLKSEETFRDYKKENKEEYGQIIYSSYNIMRMDLLFQNFDRSYMENIKKELDDVIECG